MPYIVWLGIVYAFFFLFFLKITGSVVNAVSCTPRIFSVAVAMSNAEVRLYSYANVMESLSSSPPYNRNLWGSESSCTSSHAVSQTAVKHMEVEREMDTTRETRS